METNKEIKIIELWVDDDGVWALVDIDIPVITVTPLSVFMDENNYKERGGAVPSEADRARVRKILEEK